jgi:lysozyme
VQRGDRLLKIAERFGVPLPCIVRTNRIANANLIYIGQQLLIPADCDSGGGDSGTGSGVSGSSARTCFLDRYPGRVAVNGLYTVRVGDTLDFIACDFNVALSCLLESNPEIAARRPRLIRAGEALNINFACPAWDGPPGPGDLPR